VHHLEDAAALDARGAVDVLELSGHEVAHVRAVGIARVVQVLAEVVATTELFFLTAKGNVFNAARSYKHSM
jgi:hypothetical protein